MLLPTLSPVIILLNLCLTAVFILLFPLSHLLLLQVDLLGKTQQATGKLPGMFLVSFEPVGLSFIIF